MFLRIECPGCKAVLQVEESLAGKQGKCIHCGHKIDRAGRRSALPSPRRSVPTFSPKPRPKR